MEYLCKCNNCDTILIDENPQSDAVKLELTGNEKNMIQCTLGGDLTPFLGCPICLTDEYLTDL